MALSKQISSEETEQWDLVIGPKDKWYDLRLAELWDYRDLISIFVRRDFVAAYKHTVLGPLWFFLGPIFTVASYTLVFGRIAGIPTDGIPAPVFYLGGTTLWNYFAACFGGASNTFVGNASLFGKVYFPRLAVPVAMVISNLFKFFVQMLMFLLFMFYYMLQDDNTMHITPYLLLFPVLVIQMAALALGMGLTLSSLTTKYRDLNYFIGFGMTLLMYASPVIYPMSSIPAEYKWFLEINPISPVIELFRLGFTGAGTVSAGGIIYSLVFTIMMLFLGMVMFHRTEKTFMDTV
jgi:lipopolysaccharide transport system permease protein